MFPILYEQITAGTVPEHYGLGVLSDAISVTVEQVRNSTYELEMEYPLTGIHAQELITRRVIKAKPNFTDNPQLFRIDRIGATMNGTFTVYAKHISYDLSGYEIVSGEANNAASACVLLEEAADGYTIETDKQVTATFKITTPASVRSYFAGKEGSFLDVYGSAEIKYDNFNINFLLHAGQDRGVTIRYGKNLLELSQETDSTNLYTHVLCYYKTEDETVVGTKVSTGLTLDVPKTLIIDMTDQCQEKPTVEDLTTMAGDYISGHNLTTPSNNITLDFIQSDELANRVDLCDTVSVYYEALGITRQQVKCIRTKYDCLREKYIETEFGDVKKDLTDSLIETTQTADEAASLAGNKKRVFISTPEPPYDIGDLWTNGETLFYCVTAKTAEETFDSEDWALATTYVDKSTLEVAINNATDIITGGNGGYVVLHRDADGRPYETLYMNTADITTATRILRINQNGIGLSTTGYNGQYMTAMTASGIVGDAITAGTIDASRVTIEHLTATMIKGGKLTLGGLNNQAGTFELLNEQGIPIGEMDKDGLKFYGEGAVGARPYVLLNNTVGFAGYDANGTPLFWVNRDEFTMKKCVAKEEISACGKIRMIPITLTTNNTITNDGVAIVALVETGA